MNCAPAMIVSSKCCPVSHRVLIVRVGHEHDHELRTRLLIFLLSDPGHADKLLSGFILYPFALILYVGAI
jgi:hypothetical protein